MLPCTFSIFPLEGTVDQTDEAKFEKENENDKI